MKNLYKLLSSVKLGAILLLVYAIVIAMATFIENDFGTPAANWLVYKSPVFNVLNFLLVVNMVGVFVKFKMYQRRKLSAFTFHSGFVIIIIGAAITRFISYEGSMHIREGQTSNIITSYETYLKVKVDNNDLQYETLIPVNFNEVSGADLNQSIEFVGHNITLNINDFIPNAAEKIVESDQGESLISFAIAGEHGREDVFIKEGEQKLFSGLAFNYTNTIQENVINFLNTDTGLIMVNAMPMIIKNMTDTLVQSFAAMEAAPVLKMKLYNWGPYNMVISQVYNNAIMKLEAQNDKNSFPLNAIIVNIAEDENKHKVNVFGRGTYVGQAVKFSMNELNYEISYGSTTRELPFSLKLNDFKMERYPGSMSPASYESFINLKDDRTQINEEHQIYMNNVMTHDGIRFYQSSYDNDELGTILSVNRDYWGTFITYLGYFLLSLGMFLNIFDKNSRFKMLGRKVKDLSSKSAISLTILAFFSVLSLNTQAQNSNSLPQIDAEHAAKFGELLVQDKGGRIKPINTLANEALRKISRVSSYKDLNAEQVFLGMLLSPQTWAQEPIIKIKNPDLIKRLNVKDQHTSLAAVFDETSKYILQEDVANAYAKAPSHQDKYDKAIIKVDEKVNILYMILNVDLLNIFPLVEDPNNKWYNPNDAKFAFRGEDSVFIFNVYRLYQQDLFTGLKTNNWAKADSSLSFIKMYQNKAGHEVLISDTKRDAEIFYNNSSIFRHLFEFYFIFGLAFLAFLFVKLLFPKIQLNFLVNAFVGIIILAFAIQSFGLALRWYISGHAPWSNGYESMIYISWATMLSGILFSKTSKIALAATTVLSGMILLVAHLSWIDPEITNLVPVLQSYWLTIHVAVITASYGFLALGALLGFINLIFMILKNESNLERIDSKILQLTYINEMTLTAGIFLLSIGTFLGGVWANESWGRYWGWDAKETWALITILLYAFVLHMRFIPKLKDLFSFNIMSLLSYTAVMMTYFGVNYYLSGLHSYAKGDPVPIPSFVYYTFAVIFALIIAAWYRNTRWKVNQ